MGLNGSSGSNSFFSMVAGGGSNACLHEDGGDAAIFEENDKVIIDSLIDFSNHNPHT
jgi:Xaa-Pro aminopeptidase